MPTQTNQTDFLSNWRSVTVLDPHPEFHLNERQITKQIQDLLNAFGIFHFKKWQGPLGVKGVSDIIGCREGVFLAIEVKRWPLRPTPDQVQFIHKVRAAGGVAFVAYSVIDVIKALGLEVKL